MNRPLLLVCLAVAFAWRSCQGYMFDITPGKIECIIEHLSSSRTLTMQVMVIRGGQMDIRFKVYGPYKEMPSMEDTTQLFFNQLLEAAKDEKGIEEFKSQGFQFDTEHRDGYYKLCLDNEHSTWSSKLVSLQIINSLSKNAPQDVDQKTKDEHQQEMFDALRKIEELLDKIKEQQGYHKARIMRHLLTAESNKSRATYYTLMQVGLFAALGAFQLFYVRKWFADPKAQRWA